MTNNQRSGRRLLVGVLTLALAGTVASIGAGTLCCATPAAADEPHHDMGAGMSRKRPTRP